MRRQVPLSLVLLCVALAPEVAGAQRHDRGDDTETEEARPPRRRLPPPETLAEESAETAAARGLDPKRRLELTYYEKHADEGKRTRLVGIVVTAVGAVVWAAGIGLAVYGSTYGCHNRYSSSTCDGLLGAGVGLAAVGAGTTGVGIPLWVIGSRKAKSYDDKKERLLFGLRLDSGGPLLALRLRF